MPRYARTDIEDCWYHVIARGINQQQIFHDNKDYEKYLKLLDNALQHYHGYLGAYCLMSNHIHLLIYRGKCSLGKIFHKVQGQYSLYYNKKYKRSGYLFQSRFTSLLILDDAYMHTVLLYIHQNPVRAGIVKRAIDYFWSSERWYHTGIISNFNNFRWVPGFENGQSPHEYQDMMEKGLVEYPETFEQYVGKKTKEEGPELRRRIVKRLQKERRGMRKIEAALEELSQEYELSIAELKSRTRQRYISSKRQLIMIKLYNDGYSPTDIGQLLCRNPASVIHAVERMKSQ